MPDGVTGGVLVGAVLIAMGVYGAGAVVHGVKHAVHKTGAVISQPVRHPKKDLKKILHIKK